MNLIEFEKVLQKSWSKETSSELVNRNETENLLEEQDKG